MLNTTIVVNKSKSGRAIQPSPMLADGQLTQPTQATACAVDGCENKTRALGYCYKHWLRWHKYGDPSVVMLRKLPPACTVEGCSRKPHTRFEGRAVCNMHWQRLHAFGRSELRVEVREWKTCSVPDCEKPARTRYGAICEMHDARRRRGGSDEKRVKAEWRPSSAGYWRKYDPDHPVASPSGSVFKHRAVLYDAIGPGPHACHWCSCTVNWISGRQTGKGALVVDHLDGDKANNDLGNLAPSCHRCNSTRGLFQAWVMEHKDDPFLSVLFHRAVAA